MKDATLSKLAFSAGNLFDDAYQMAKTEKEVFKQEWTVALLSKSQQWIAMAHIFKSRDLYDSQNYGAEIGHLQLSLVSLRKPLEPAVAKLLPPTLVSHLKATRE